jgi:hypothetical protein
VRAARATVATVKHFMVDVGGREVGKVGSEWNEGAGDLG